MWLFIEALDILLFRDSKPFAAGESVWARSVFPPNPLPFVGALRAKLLVDNDISFNEYHKFLKKEDLPPALKQKARTVADFIGSSEDYGRLTLAGPLLARQIPNDQFISFFPSPLDIMSGRNNVKYLQAQNFGWKLKTSKALTGKTIYGFSSLPLWTDESGDLPEGRFLKTSGVIRYLKNSHALQFEESENLWGSEFQVGIERGAQRAAEVGKIYSVEFIRLREFINNQGLFSNGFLVCLPDDFDNIRFETEGFLALGGEGRAAKYTKIEETGINNLNELINGNFLTNALLNQNRFKLYLASPAVFDSGWYPDFLTAAADDGELIGEVGGLRFKLISASVNKPTTVSGWNLAENRPRPSVKAVPAGSVYHFELLDGEVFSEEKINVLRDKYHFKNLTGLGLRAARNIPQNDLNEYGKIGFGLALLGKI